MMLCACVKTGFKNKTIMSYREEGIRADWAYDGENWKEQRNLDLKMTDDSENKNIWRKFLVLIVITMLNLVIINRQRDCYLRRECDPAKWLGGEGLWGESLTGECLGGRRSRRRRSRRRRISSRSRSSRRSGSADSSLDYKIDSIAVWKQAVCSSNLKQVFRE